MDDLKKYFIRKTLRYSVIVFIVLTINFILPRMMPGDPTDILLGEASVHVSEEVINSLKERYGLDKPVSEQYIMYLQSIFTFDFGFSLSNNSEIVPLLLNRMKFSVMLLLPSIIIGAIVALSMGTYVGSRAGTKLDKVSVAFCTFMFTIPSFLISMLAVTVFGYELGWFPLGQMSSGNSHGSAELFFDVAFHLFLPVMVLSFLGATSKFLMIRNTSATIHKEYFVFAARSRGLDEETIRKKYVRKNILPQFISVVAMNFGFMISGSMLIEIVFSLNGMGTLIYNSILALDYPMIQACFIFIVLLALISNFIAELLYGIADPRVGDSYTTSRR